MKILLTGATGFVGKHLLDKLLQSNNEIFATNKTLPSTPKRDQLTWIEWDFNQPIQVNRFPKKLDAIIHLAAQNSTIFPLDARSIFNTNVNATLDLLQYATQLELKHFIHVSTGGVYGFSENKHKECEKIFLQRSNNFYITSKLISEIISDSYQPLLPLTTLRLFFPYGPHQQTDRLIPRLINNIKNKNDIPLAGHDGISINPIYIDDVIDIFLKILLGKPQGFLNVAGHENISLRLICEKIGYLLDEKPNFLIKENIESTSILGDTQKIETELKYKSYTPFDVGMKHMLNKTISI